MVLKILFSFLKIYTFHLIINYRCSCLDVVFDDFYAIKFIWFINYIHRYKQYESPKPSRFEIVQWELEQDKIKQSNLFLKKSSPLPAQLKLKTVEDNLEDNSLYIISKNHNANIFTE